MNTHYKHLGDYKHLGELLLISTHINKQEDHNGPISLTWANRFAYLLLKFSAKFTALGFLYKFYSTNPPPPQPPPPPPPPPHPRPCFFNASWRLELNLKRGSPKEHFCQVILKLVQWFKVFYITIKPYPLTAMFFDESWQLEQTW